MTAAAEKFEPTDFVAKGLRYSGDAKALRVILQKVVAGKLVETERHFDYGKDTKRFRAGFLYTMEANESKIKPATARIGDEWPKASERDEWRVLTEAACADDDCRKRENSARAEEDVLHSIDPIRRAYQRTNSTGKIAIELMVLRYLRKPFP